jgi:hypothetical protein
VGPAREEDREREVRVVGRDWWPTTGGTSRAVQSHRLTSQGRAGTVSSLSRWSQNKTTLNRESTNARTDRKALNFRALQLINRFSKIHRGLNQMMLEQRSVDEMRLHLLSGHARRIH